MNMSSKPNININNNTINSREYVYDYIRDIRDYEDNKEHHCEKTNNDGTGITKLKLKIENDLLKIYNNLSEKINQFNNFNKKENEKVNTLDNIKTQFYKFSHAIGNIIDTPHSISKTKKTLTKKLKLPKTKHNVPKV